MTPQEVQPPCIYELLAHCAHASPPVQGQRHAWVEGQPFCCLGIEAFSITLHAHKSEQLFLHFHIPLLQSHHSLVSLPLHTLRFRYTPCHEVKADSDALYDATRDREAAVIEDCHCAVCECA